MRFGLLSEGDTPKGMTHYHRYHELLEEVELAEAVGFDFWGTSEQHFLPTICSVSAPETLYGAVAMRTSRIKLRHMSVLMLAFNHPLRVAERLATLDILSHGRLELSTARANSPATLDAFGVEASETRDQWREGLEATIRALTEDPFEFTGKYYTIPPRSVAPRLYRDKMFPVSMIATSMETFTLAGNSGLGVIMNDNYVGWDYIERAAALYKEAIKNPVPFAPYEVNDSLGFCVYTANCDSDVERAYETARHVAEGFCTACHHYYVELAKRSPSYTDLGRIEEVHERRRDLEFMMSNTPSVVLGKPDVFIDTARRLQSLGVDELVLRIDGFGHEQNMRSIEMIGKYVIPQIKAAKAVVTPSQYVSEMGVATVPELLL